MSPERFDEICKMGWHEFARLPKGEKQEFARYPMPAERVRDVMKLFWKSQEKRA